MPHRRPALLGLVLAAVAAVAVGGAGAQPMPDLVFNASAVNPSITVETFAPSHCAVVEGCVQAGTRRLLRFRTESLNIGNADMVLGNPVGNPLFHYHDCHGHYHFEGFADYRLVNTGGLVAQGFKASFCLLDTFRHNPMANPQPVYNCSNQGIQAGWADVYGSQLDCQWIDITDVPAGHYTLELEVNPDLLLTESNYANNVASVEVDIPAPPTATPTRTATPTATALPPPVLNAIAAPIVLGAANGLSGSGFTAGSRVVLYVATSNGALTQGPFTPTAWSPTSLTWMPPASVPVGNGFATVQVVNTDQNFVGSNLQSQWLYYAAGSGRPTITGVNGVGLGAPNVGVPLANVATAMAAGAPATITGTGFLNPVVALYSSNPVAVALEPLAGGTSTQFQVTVPADVPIGPGAIQVLNRPSFLGSAPVSVPLGEAIRLDSVSQSMSTITVTGAGFSPLTVISFFNVQNNTVVNLGGLVNGSQSLIPFTLKSSHQLSFAVPANAVSGPSYVQLLNPPYIPFTSTGATPNGAFNVAN